MSSHQLDEEAIFHTARKIDNNEARLEYLDQICAGDLNLRGRVEALLEVHEQEREFLKSSPDPAPTEARLPITEQPGRQVGRYIVISDSDVFLRTN